MWIGIWIWNKIDQESANPKIKSDQFYKIVKHTHATVFETHWRIRQVNCTVAAHKQEPPDYITLISDASDAAIPVDLC